MPFSVGDKVVHPQHGPGLITGIEARGPTEGKSYYVIAIQGQSVTLYVPALGAGVADLRAAMSQARLARVLRILSGKPHALSPDHRRRAEQITAGLQRGGVLDLVGVVRDLTFHGAQSHLTQKDSDYLRKGRERLASEIALVSGSSLADASKLIRDSMVLTTA